MQTTSINILVFTALLIIFSILLLWWSSYLMFDRRKVSGGVHVMLMGIIVAYGAGSFFYGSIGAVGLLVLLIMSISSSVSAYFWELKLRSEEKSISIII